MARVVDRQARRDELVSAAARVFADQGVANTAVSDIVGTAGVAQGTFYLYFQTKDDIVLAVVERFADGMMTALEEAVDKEASSAVDELRALGRALSDLTSLPGAADISRFLHLPENRPLHDRLDEHLTPRLTPIVKRVVEHGVAQGVFSVPDPQAAAWFVLGGLRSVEWAGVPLAGLPAALDAATDLALRVLGWTGTGA
jgi:TetR/AcrR family transcriptional regulator, fatty acid metabolism regulator protein